VNYDCVSLKGRYYIRYWSSARERRMENRYSQKLFHLYWSLDIIRKINVVRLRWAGYLQRIGSNEIPSRIMDFRLLRKDSGEWWMDGVWKIEEVGDPKMVDGCQG
jgi:hypothetical protein